ncbi:hypothetical protein EIP91_011711 [Steccherinum ochraceum]|uniref:Polysaccharide lyase 14 domain-containing protein n=1 Tax=Steccherinum ochraceum TaxID=92696 RepID=A0A4R0RUK4_9APHY|nr:hypothetical protein EIP91_011711 [Steccherinum ochraceum]
MSKSFLAYSLICAPLLVLAQLAAPSDIASQNSLTTSTSLPFPTATASSSDAQTFITSGWSLSKGRIQNGGDHLEFVQDPFPDAAAPGTTTAPSGPVLQVTYPSGSFGSTDSGAQFYTLWNTTDGSQFNSMLVSYEVAVDSSFPFVKGGKLPGLRGGPEPDGCSGGNAANGTNCFSSRVMWRTSGQGEVYGYFPNDESSSICSQNQVICNSDGFGTSLDRGSFQFTPAQWGRVTMLVRLNSPVNSVNGQVELYFNNVLAANFSDIEYRSSSVINVGGFYFSTFFGGNDASWAPNDTTHAYFRNIQLWGSSTASNLTAASPARLGAESSPAQWLFGLAVAVAGALIGGVM